MKYTPNTQKYFTVQPTKNTLRPTYDHESPKKRRLCIRKVFFFPTITFSLLLYPMLRGKLTHSQKGNFPHSLRLSFFLLFYSPFISRRELMRNEEDESLFRFFFLGFLRKKEDSAFFTKSSMFLKFLIQFLGFLRISDFALFMGFSGLHGYPYNIVSTL